MARLKYYSKKTNAWETVDSTFGTGNVKTVNGVEPDANGNIEIAVPGMPEINYPVTSVNGMTGDVVIEVGSEQNLTLDTTLTQSGKAADAKAVGDALDELEEKIPSIKGLAKEYDIPKVPNWAMQASKPAYTASEVGADPKGTAAATVSSHNTSTDAHTDLRLEVKALREQLAAFLDTDEETLNELSELIARILANQTSIEQLTSGKVNVSDIVNNLVTNVTNKPLSAAQGVELKKLIDNVSASLANYQPKGNYALASDVPTKVSQLQNDAKYLTTVTAAMITAALGYTPINPGLATLARHTDGLLYLFVDGKPVGSGVELPTGGIDGYITADKQIIFNNLPDGEYTLAYINDDGDIIRIGALEKDTNVYYSVTKNLTNCTISNSATKVAQGSAYSATITAKSGYELDSVTVTMGGSPVTVSGGTISITNVTGNIVITAVAEEKAVAPSYKNLLPLAVNADGTPYEGGKGYKSGYKMSTSSGSESATTGAYCSGFMPLSSMNDVVRIKNITLSGSANVNNIVFYDTNKTKVGNVNANGSANAFHVNVEYKNGCYEFKPHSWINVNPAFFRFSCGGITSDTIVTVNQEIV